MERLRWCERALRMLGILIVATLPLAARRRWRLPSLECSEAVNGPEISVRWMSCSGWIICNIFSADFWKAVSGKSSGWTKIDHFIPREMYEEGMVVGKGCL